MRFLAATMVLYGHCFPLLGKGETDFVLEATAGFLPMAHLGVCIFFSISGYLIIQSLERSPTIIGYLWKRSLRIFPGLAVSLVVVVLACFWLSNLSFSEYFWNKQTLKFLLNIKIFPPYYYQLPTVFSSNPILDVNGSLWTLCYEYSMYLILIPLVFLPRKWWKIILSIIVLCGMVAYQNLYLYTGNIPILHLNTFHFIEFGMYFMAGSCLYCFKEKIPFTHHGAIIALAIWFGAFWLQLHYAVITLLWVRLLAVPYLVLWGSLLRSPLEKFGQYGDFSYGLYIYAFPVQQLFVYMGGKSLSVTELFLKSFLLTFVLAWLSWHGVEKRFLMLKKWVK